MKKYGRTYDHCILISRLRRALTVQSVGEVPGNVTENAAAAAAAAANQQLQNVPERCKETTESAARASHANLRNSCTHYSS